MTTLRLAQQAWRANRIWWLTVIAYFVLLTLYGFTDEGAGPLSPSGKVHLPGVLLLLAVLTLRLIVLFAAAPMLIYRLVRWRLGGTAGPGSR
jgi:hypothetical protein